MFIDPTGLSGVMPDGSYHITHPLDQKLLELKQEWANATPQSRAEIAKEADDIRASGEGDVDRSVSADRSLEYYTIIDITDKLDDLMLDAKDKYGFYKHFGNAIAIPRFYFLVRNGAEYDLKNQAEWKKQQFIYDDEIIDNDVPGNINFGYLGTAMGIDELTLIMSAGVAQIRAGTSMEEWRNFENFGDDPRDTERIKQGINTYNSWHK